MLIFYSVYCMIGFDSVLNFDLAMSDCAGIGGVLMGVIGVVVWLYTGTFENICESVYSSGPVCIGLSVFCLRISSEPEVS